MGGDGIDIVPEGYTLPHGERSLTVFNSYVGDGFFDTMGIRLIKGRGFLETDQEKTPLVAVMEEHLANHYWPKTDVIGKRFHLNNSTGPLVHIVGVAKATKHFWIAEPQLDYVYLSSRQNPRSELTLIAQTNTEDASRIAPELRQIVRGLDPNMPIYDTRTMEDLYTQRAVKTPDMIVNTVAGLGLMGLILAMVGLYGLIAYSVSRRTREFGIRMAIGADRFMVIRMVLKQGFVLGAIGVGVGLAIGIAACRLVTSGMVWMASFNATNPLLFAAIALPLLGITVLATYAPARRASRIDPMRALRDE